MDGTNAVETGKHTHHLKSWPKPFADLSGGRRTYELRINDRNYRMGDRLVFHEWSPTGQGFTGAWVIADVVHVSTAESYDGVLAGMLGENVACLGLNVRAGGFNPDFVIPGVR